jgi:hypothetical protein
LPPELAAVAAERQQDSIVRDPIAVLSQRASRAEIESIGQDEWLILYSYEADDFGRRGYFCALIPQRRVRKVMGHDSWDLMIGDGLPGFSQSYTGGKIKRTYCKFGSSSVVPLVFSRSFHGLKPDQFDLLEEFRHFHNLYHDRRNDKYIFIDERGEEDVVVEVRPKLVRAKLRYVKQFMAARRLHLAVYFDNVAEAPIDVAEAKKALQNELVNRDDLRFSFHVGDAMGKTLSRLLGKKLIKPPPLRECGVWPFEASVVRQYVRFVIAVDENGRNVEHTCDETSLADYFGKNAGSAHYLTPVWFRREVLRKYYDHPEKYSVEDGYLRGGSLWGLRLDNDLPNHVVVYLGDLGGLAHDEQLYWRSFNSAPAASRSSEMHFKRSFLAQFADPISPDLVFKQKLVALQESWEQRFGWQLFRRLHDDDAHVIKQLRVPLTDSIGEFELQSLLLAKLLVDSLNDKQLTSELGVGRPDEKSISKLERFLEKAAYQHRDRDIKLLRLLQAARSTAAAHGKGENYDKVSKQLDLRDRPASEVFRELLTRVNAMLADLQDFFVPSAE